jgi:hypothetical protein
MRAETSALMRGTALVALAIVSALQFAQLGSTWLFGHASPPFVAGTAITAAALFSWLINGRRFSAACRTLAVASALFGACSLISYLLHDFSHDGQQYHQQAVIALWMGWNPLGPGEYIGPYAIWLNSYAKGAWLYGAALATLTGSVEAGKGINLLLASVSAILSFQALYEHTQLNRLWSALSATALALSPVVATQWPTYYNDGAIASLLLIFLVGAARCCLQSRRDCLDLTLVFLAVFLLFGIKGSGAAYAIASSVLLVTALVTLRKPRTAAYAAFATAGAACLAVLTIGFNPYITNTVRYGHPLYPLAGKNRPVDIIAGNASPDFLSLTRVEKLFLSTFSKSLSTVSAEQRVASDQVDLKWPGWIYGNELQLFFSRTDVRIGGFGPLFSLTLCVGMLGFVLWMATSTFSASVLGKVILAPTAIVFLTLLFPEPWWARYVPQFWLLPLLLVIGCTVATPDNLAVKHAARATIVIALANCALVAGLFATRTIARELDLRAQLTSLRKISQAVGPVSVTFGSTPSTRVRLSQADILVRERSGGDSCALEAPVNYADAMLCLSAEQLPLYRSTSSIVEDVKKAIGRGRAVQGSSVNVDVLTPSASPSAGASADVPP